MSGIQSKKIAQDKPSMNLAFTTKSPEAYMKGNILHEFGHVLGLRHEHLNPENKIKWNKPVVYKYFTEKRGWTKEMVDKNLFNEINKDLTNYGIYDKFSVMHYRVDKSWTLDGFYVNSNPNPTLSVQDKLFISEQYPYSANTKGLYRYRIVLQYYYTVNTDDYDNYILNPLGRIYYTQTTNTYPIYKYYNIKNGDRVLTLNWNELQNGNNNWKYEGIFGYAYKTKQPNTVPIYRYIYNKNNVTTHLFTLASNINSIDFKPQGIAFYVLKN